MLFQVLLNCVEGVDVCAGGDPGIAYEYIQSNTIPDESCAPYEAEPRECTAIQTCKNCWPEGCYSMKSGEYTPYTISDHGQVSGDEAVMQEIADHGPVACRVCASDSFLEYENGIFSDPSACPNDDSKHYVVLSGWGEADGTKYWIGRNSWGTYWGEDGWFKVAMGDGDLGITQECYWATPEPPEYRYLWSQDAVSTKAQGLRDIFRYTSAF